MSVRWRIVWLICSPFVFVTATIWIWYSCLLPAKYDMAAEMDRSARIAEKSSRESRYWKRKYNDLYFEATFLAGENAALNKSFEKVAGISLQQTINEKAPQKTLYKGD